MRLNQAYKYCPNCGTKAEQKQRYLHCPNCGHDLYFNPKPCTAVVLVDEKGEYLLVRRAVEPGKGKLDAPGGFVEQDETFEENAAREIKEELGINVKPEDLVYITSTTEPYPFQGVDYPTIAVVFVAKFPAGAKPKPADDVASFEFFQPSKIPADEFAFEAMKKDLKAVADYLRENKL